MYSRDIETQIKKYLNSEKILILTWARQVWKTTLLKKYYELSREEWKQSFFLNLERPQYLDLLNKDPENIFSITGKTTETLHVFIDEIQKLDDPTTFLKYLYDEYSTRGVLKLFVTWSSAFYIDKKFKDSLAWRKHLLHLYSLSFQEFLVFKQKPELLWYIGHSIPLIIKTELEQLAYEYIVYGGYPEVVLQMNFEDKKELLYELTNSYIKKDIKDARLKYEHIYFQLMKLMASQVWNLVNYHELSRTLDGIEVPTVKDYMTVMRKSFHVAFISPFFNNKRKEITKMPKVYFYDTGIKNAIMNNFDPFPLRLWNERWWLLENFFFRLLLASRPLDAIHFRRNNNKNEVDFVVWEKAREVKSNLKKFSLNKYKVFTAQYPQIDLEWVDLQKMLEIIL